MSTLTSAWFSEPTALKSFFRHVGDVVAGIREGLAMAHRYDELASLSDAELAKRGLARADIPQAIASEHFH
jgi:hypothetical protein